MYGWMHACMHAFIQAYGCFIVCVVCMYGCMHACMHGCTHEPLCMGISTMLFLWSCILVWVVQLVLSSFCSLVLVCSHSFVWLCLCCLHVFWHELALTGPCRGQHAVESLVVAAESGRLQLLHETQWDEEVLLGWQEARPGEAINLHAQSISQISFKHSHHYQHEDNNCHACWQKAKRHTVSTRRAGGKVMDVVI